MYKSNQEPDIDSALGPFSNLSITELKDLLNDDDKFEEMIKDNQQVKIVFYLLILYYSTV